MGQPEHQSKLISRYFISILVCEEAAAENKSE
jgi:hypothetical protein